MCILITLSLCHSQQHRMHLQDVNLQQSAVEPACTAKVLFMDKSCFTGTWVNQHYHVWWDENLCAIRFLVITNDSLRSTWVVEFSLTASWAHTYIHYITFHGSKVSQMTVGCGISHTITKTYIQFNWSIPYVHTHTHININQILSTYTMHTNLYEDESVYQHELTAVITIMFYELLAKYMFKYESWRTISIRRRSATLKSWSASMAVQICPGRWIGRGLKAPISWPGCSPDLKPLDHFSLFLLGIL
jgi:hypothetical protein